jgi:hypothetical protein
MSDYDDWKTDDSKWRWCLPDDDELESKMAKCDDCGGNRNNDDHGETCAGFKLNAALSSIANLSLSLVDMTSQRDAAIAALRAAVEEGWLDGTAAGDDAREALAKLKGGAE